MADWKERFTQILRKFNKDTAPEVDRQVASWPAVLGRAMMATGKGYRRRPTANHTGRMALAQTDGFKRGEEPVFDYRLDKRKDKRDFGGPQFMRQYRDRYAVH